MKSLKPKIDKIYIEISSSCNFHCDFCTSSVSRRRRQYMDFDLFKKISNEIAREKITERIGFHVLGEPLLYPRLYDAVRHVKERGLTLEITTNGSLLSSRTVENLLNLGLDKLNISLITTDKKEHAFRRSTIDFDEYYHTILNAVGLIRASSPKTKIELILMNTYSRKYFEMGSKKNIVMNEEKDEFRERLSSFIMDVLSATGENGFSKKSRKTLAGLNLNNPQILAIDDGLGIYITLLGDGGNALTDKNVYPATIGFCGFALRYMGILTNGNVTLCCADFDGNTALGNVHSDSLLSLLNSKRAGDISEGFKRMRIVHPYCRRCLGGTGRINAFIKGILSIYAFKIKQPIVPREVNLSIFGGRAS